MSAGRDSLYAGLSQFLQASTHTGRQMLPASKLVRRHMSAGELCVTFHSPQPHPTTILSNMTFTKKSCFYQQITEQFQAPERICEFVSFRYALKILAGLLATTTEL
jgi:hypothetical protein